MTGELDVNQKWRTSPRKLVRPSPEHDTLFVVIALTLMSGWVDDDPARPGRRALCSVLQARLPPCMEM